VQEIVLATRFSLHCGDQFISSRIMVPVCETLQQSKHYPTGNLSKRSYALLLVGFSQWSNIVCLRKWNLYRPRANLLNGLLLHIMYMCDKSKCTDVRDYVYAFAALDPSCEIVVNYNMSFKQLLKQIRSIERNTIDSLYRSRHGSVTKSLRRKMLDEQIDIEKTCEA
jgi:hypothetical protein